MTKTNKTTDQFEYFLDEGSEPDLFIRSMALNAVEIERLGQPSLWHLNAVSTGAARFLDAWTVGSAEGMTINIVDEGINYRHADLDHAYDVDQDYDPRDEDEDDAIPDSPGEWHGTHVAGLIAGNAENDFGTAGAALGAMITATYLRYGKVFEMSELADIIERQADFAVSNNSWGFGTAFADNFVSRRFDETEAALQTVVETGRDGLGTVMVFAAGNGKIETAAGNIGDDSNFHNLQNSRFTIAVGAHDSTGAPAAFSSPGANVLLTAPGVGVLTTHGSEVGSTGSAYVSGTSFATPLVSSAVAIMLAENPNLGYRDVKEILALSATSRLDGNAQVNGNGHFNGGGLMFDREGGFGLLDAGAAAALARNWTKTSTFANEQQLSLSFDTDVDLDPSIAVLEAELVNSGDEGFAADVIEFSFTVFDRNLKDLRIDLISPDGTRATIAENFKVASAQSYLSFTFTSVATWGENPYGTWRLELTHANPSPEFFVHSADVHVYGDVDTPDDAYFYTDSFAGLVAQDSERSDAIDTDGGNDTLNFAASRGAVSLDLSKATQSTFQGHTLNLEADFENAIGSTAGDTLIGSAGANRLVGEAGADILIGGAGDDTLLGGLDNDRLDGGAGSDTIDGGRGVDTYVLGGAWSDYAITYDAALDVYSFARSGEVDTVRGIELFAFSNVTLRADALATGVSDLIIAGTDGADLLRGRCGEDILIGGEGDDLYVIGADGGTDTIAGFAAGDKIAFEGSAAIRNFDDVLARATQVDEDTVVDLGGGNTLTLQNTEKATLNTDDFVFRMFQSPTFALDSFGTASSAGGWSSDNRYPRTVADVNGDGRADIIGFGGAGAYVALANADGSFDNPILGIDSFGLDAPAGGWAGNKLYLRDVADVNGDGWADLVGFGGAGAYVALSKGDGTFDGPILGLNSFGPDASAGSWENDNQYPRALADVNGDGRADIIGFGGVGTYVALANADGTFQGPVLGINSFGADIPAGGWASSNVYSRAVADVNGDGLADLVGFGGAGAYVALSNGDGTFRGPILGVNSFGADAAAGGWTSDSQYPRTLADVNGDGRADIVGFGASGLYIALGCEDGTFQQPSSDVESFGYGIDAGGWLSNDSYPRVVADINDDGRADIIGFGSGGVFVTPSYDFLA